ncbi:MAG: hypothetical protein GY742_12850 [Hyphomicrobiales bacterium]|nr:hypothetical protein [Hyphomicrobiales bacterium]
MLYKTAIGDNRENNKSNCGTDGRYRRQWFKLGLTGAKQSSSDENPECLYLGQPDVNPHQQGRDISGKQIVE